MRPTAVQIDKTSVAIVQDSTQIDVLTATRRAAEGQALPKQRRSKCMETDSIIEKRDFTGPISKPKL